MARADVCRKYLQELNQNVHLKVATDNSIEQM